MLGCVGLGWVGPWSLFVPARSGRSVGSWVGLGWVGAVRLGWVVLVWHETDKGLARRVEDSSDQETLEAVSLYFGSIARGRRMRRRA